MENKDNGFIQKKIMPIAVKMGNNKGLIAIRDGMTMAMPLIIIGSLFMIIASFPIAAWEELLGRIGVADYLWKGVDSSFNLIALVASFGIAYSYARQCKVDGVSAGIVSLAAFVMVTPFVKAEDGAGMPTAYMASKGLFVAIILGLINGNVYQKFINKGIEIKLPDSVPPAVSKSFSAIIPGAVILTFWLIVYAILDKFGLPNMHQIAQVVLGKPLGLLGNNVIGVAVLIMFNSLFRFVGIHGGNVVNSIMQPLWLANLGANAEAQKAGETIEHIFTAPFMDNFVYMGGGGATLGLVIALAVIAKKKNASKQSKVLAPLTLTPGFFNINEPAMFGIPIVLNIVLLIPFIVAPIVNMIISYRQ